MNPFGAVIDFDKPHDHNRYWVYCPNYSTCGGFEQRRVDKYNIDTQPFQCSKCLGKSRSSNLKQAWSALKGNGQKNGSAEDRKRQHKDRKLLEAVNGIANIWQQVRNYDRKTYQQRLSEITQVDLAGELGIKGLTDRHKRTQVRNRLIDCRVKEMFPDGLSFYHSFVEFVVEQFEKKMTSAEIVSSLNSRLPS